MYGDFIGFSGEPHLKIIHQLVGAAAIHFEKFIYSLCTVMIGGDLMAKVHVNMLTYLDVLVTKWLWFNI